MEINSLISLEYKRSYLPAHYNLYWLLFIMQTANENKQTSVQGKAAAKGMILVTGGLGYIGSHTVIELLSEGHQVVIVDNL